MCSVKVPVADQAGVTSGLVSGPVSCVIEPARISDGETYIH